MELILPRAYKAIGDTTVVCMENIADNENVVDPEDSLWLKQSDVAAFLMSLISIMTSYTVDIASTGINNSD